jgi:hypothetical protein
MLYMFNNFIALLAHCCQMGRKVRWYLLWRTGQLGPAVLFIFGQVLVDVGDIRRMVLTTRLALQQISPHDDHLPVCFSWSKRFAWSLVGAQWHFTVGFVFLTCLQNSFDLFAMVFTVLDLAHL